MIVQREADLRKIFCMQRHNALRRKVLFNLTFEQWLDIWNKSGKLRFRGRGKGKYCMARFGDTGPYAVGNVKIILHSDNVRESSNRGFPKGSKHTDAAKEKMRVAKLYQK